MKIAIIGLGRMGSQIAKKLHEGGHTVIAFNRSSPSIDEMKSIGMIGTYSKEEVVSAFATDERVTLWLMLPSESVDAELDLWLSLVPKGSLIIDGGNSDFRLTKKRAVKVIEAGSAFMDVGTSGGIWGYKNGFAMMAGGEKKEFYSVEEVLKTLALPEGAYQYFGTHGAGHYVKMVHNAIEYGMMESLAEGYRMLKEGPYENVNLADAGEVWQHHSVVTSWLNELSRDVLKENPTLEGIEGTVAESGEARWALEVAKELDIETPSISGAFDVRIRSQSGTSNFATKLLAAMRNAFGGHKINN